MAGPAIQMPSSLSQMFDTDEKGNILALKTEWASFFHALQQVAFISTRSGATGSRPTSSTGTRFIGEPYFDTTLGKPVFLKIASTNVWVDAAGNVV